MFLSQLEEDGGIRNGSDGIKYSLDAFYMNNINGDKKYYILRDKIQSNEELTDEEICFSKLNKGQAVLENKTKPEGEQRRLEILKRYYSESDFVIDKYLKDVPTRKKIDDVIDALVLAVSGAMGLENKFETIPKKPMKDIRGIKMQMTYGKI